MLAGFEALGLDTDAILRGAGLTRAQIDDPYAGFPEGLFEVIWRQAFLQDPRPDLPTRAGLAVPFGAFGLLDHLGASSQTVGEAFHTLRLFFWLVATGVKAGIYTRERRLGMGHQRAARPRRRD